MASNEEKLLNSLIDYINDVKPYHTKLLDFTSELLFEDNFNISIKDNLQSTIYFQNIWTRDSVGGFLLTSLSEGLESDKIFRIPAAIWPRVSIDDSLNYNQSPIVSSINLIDFNNDGFPDSSEVVNGRFYSLHQLGSDQIEVDAKIIATSVEINSASETSGTYDYNYNLTIDLDLTEEGSYGFGLGKHIFIDDVLYVGSITEVGNSIIIDNLTSSYTPSVEDLLLLENAESATPEFFAGFYESTKPHKINVLYFETGRYRIPYHQGSRIFVNDIESEYNVAYVVDLSYGFIQFLPGYKPALTDEITLDLFENDSFYISYNYPFIFSSGNEDFFTITINSSLESGYSLNFTTTGSTINRANLDVLEIYPGAVDGTVYKIKAINYWNFSVEILSPIPEDLGSLLFKSEFNDGKIKFKIDNTWSEYNYSNFGQINIIEETPGNRYYQFSFNIIPPKGTYIELRIDQNNNLNQVLNTSILETLSFSEIFNFSESLCTNSIYLSGQVSGGDYDLFPLDENPLDIPNSNADFADEYYPSVPTVNWYPTYEIPEDPLDLALFNPNCENLINNPAVPETFYPYFRDDMYLTEIINGIDIKITHNVDLHTDATFYQEPEDVNELVLHHGKGVVPSGITVYFNGGVIIPDNIDLDEQRIILVFNTAKSVAVSITY